MTLAEVVTLLPLPVGLTLDGGARESGGSVTRTKEKKKVKGE